MMIDQQQYPDQESQAQPWADEPASSQEPLGEEEEADRNLLEWIENDLWGLPVLRNNRRFILFCLFLGAIAIAWPYFYQGSLREITSLEEKLKDIRYKSLYTSAALIEYERINNIVDKVSQYQLQLVPATQPPYLLVDSGQYPLARPH
ncbi:hypothetical protein HMPREF1556_01036 [Porphyromonas sp. oral taxon 278 str. W7784]|jgi:hypothetical protein|uniref:FtsL-like putative cell division protein n=1 Tax=Porphyromonas sp. oral taxon 278 TaxID=712437 RepID=UPI0003AD54FA|nr:FtsL-like putative cell division protein [Porphyromonas sp. oral taxon 278]ERJ71929.1 hypothetical protein HMPREF1556_01036 [Porphyromonas sp. oral taxon 278 str. W7784]